MTSLQLVQISPSELADLIKEGLKSELQELLQQFKEQPHDQKEFLTRKETAEFFAISLVCLHDWCKKDILTPYKMGNRTYFNYSELVETMLSSNQSKA
jgi:hypothetical protein